MRIPLPGHTRSAEVKRPHPISNATGQQTQKGFSEEMRRPVRTRAYDGEMNKLIGNSNRVGVCVGSLDYSQKHICRLSSLYM